MTFPILTSLIALPIVGSLALLFVRDDDEHEGLVRNTALVVSLLVFAETLLLWAQFDPTSADFQFVERHALDSQLRHQLCGRRRRHQPAAPAADRLPDAAGASQLVEVGAQEDPGVLHLRAAARERDDRRVRLSGSLPLLRLLGRHAHPDVFPHRDLGLRAAHLRRRQVHSLHDRRQRADAAGDHRPRLAAQHTRRAVQLRPAGAVRSASPCRTCSSGSSWRSRSPLRSRCRCFRFTPGCPTRTSRRRRPAR